MASTRKVVGTPGSRGSPSTPQCPPRLRRALAARSWDNSGRCRQALRRRLGGHPM